LEQRDILSNQYGKAEYVAEILEVIVPPNPVSGAELRTRQIKGLPKRGQARLVSQSGATFTLTILGVPVGIPAQADPQIMSILVRDVDPSNIVPGQLLTQNAEDRH
jgi:hypothetical protein